MAHGLPLLLAALILFVLNLTWEVLHSHLYAGVPRILEHLPYLIIASLGDVLLAMVPVTAFGLWNRRIWWFRKLTGRRIAAFLVVSTIVSATNESINLLILHRWEYTAQMPTLPILPIGVSPLLQLAVTPLLSLLVTNLILRISY